jgi:hypothetical protein
LDKSRSYGASANAEELRYVFIKRVHQLLELGYRRMDAKAFAREAEPVITGELARAMNSAIDDNLSPQWVHYFQVQDEQPVNDGIRKGKHRKRIDIGVQSSRPRPRDHFSFEAKLLGPNNRLRDYLGQDGLQCFLRGDYAASERGAGMLGYIQSGSEKNWGEKLQAALRDPHDKHQVCDDCHGLEYQFKDGPLYTYHSRHIRQTAGSRIDIFHTFLSFQ